MVFTYRCFSPLVRNYIHADTTGLLFLVIWIAVWLLFLLIAWCYSKTGNQIYSAHSEINLAINIQEHRSWSWMFFFYSLCNSLAFISELIFLANDLEWYWWSHLLFFYLPDDSDCYHFRDLLPRKEEKGTDSCSRRCTNIRG